MNWYQASGVRNLVEGILFCAGIVILLWWTVFY